MGPPWDLPRASNLSCSEAGDSTGSQPAGDMTECGLRTPHYYVLAEAPWAVLKLVPQLPYLQKWTVAVPIPLSHCQDQ